MIFIIFPLFEIIAFGLSQQIRGDNQYCLYPPTCKRVNFTGGPDRSGPFHDHLLSNVPHVPDVDNTCNTGFSLDNSSMLLIRVLVYKDGSQNTEKIIYSGIPGYPGAYRGEGLTNSSGCSSCVFNDYFLGGLECPCEGVFAFYRCYFYGDCVAENNGPDMLFGYSIDEQISDYCYSKLIDFVEPFGLQGPGYVRLPYNKSTKCINTLAQLSSVSNNNN